jgi:protein-S-isoprenylcysteine O-methyltransferase Ste14
MLLAGALWIVFMVYWSAAAQKATPLARSESKESRALHSNLLTLAQLLLFIPVPGLRMRFVPPATWVALLGLVVQSLGLLLAIASRRHLGRNWSHVVGSVRDHELVRSGPYRWVRHPIYSAMFLMFAGICLVAGELHALAGFALLIVAYTRKIRQEERHLREFFGPAYDDYCRETRAVIPGLL